MGTGLAVCRPGFCVNTCVTCAVQSDVDQWVIVSTRWQEAWEAMFDWRSNAVSQAEELGQRVLDHVAQEGDELECPTIRVGQPVIYSSSFISDVECVREQEYCFPMRTKSCRGS